MPMGRVIGQRMPLTDAKEKLLGAAVFGADFARPGMLVGRLLRSPHPHARIRQLDATRARALKGVRLVCTALEVSRDQLWIVAPG